MDSQADIVALFDAERETRRLHRALCDQARGANEAAGMLALLRTAMKQAMGLDQSEGALRLVRISSILQEIEGEPAADALIEVLNSEWPEARLAAGEAIEAKLFDRFKEVAMAIERALNTLPKGSVALAELPYLIGEVGEPSSLRLLSKFLAHSDADVVASAIEALVEMQDPEAIDLLKPLEKDRRKVVLDDEDDTDEVTLGELATEAIEQLSE